MNCDNWLLLKNSLIAATTGFALIKSCGNTVSMSSKFIRSLMLRSMRTKPSRNLVFQQLAHRTHATIAQVIDVVDFALAHLEIDEIADHFDNVLRRQSPLFEGQIEASFLLSFNRPTGERS